VLDAHHGRQFSKSLHGCSIVLKCFGNAAKARLTYQV
jgi:hypothetical protein